MDYATGPNLKPEHDYGALFDDAASFVVDLDLVQKIARPGKLGPVRYKRLAWGRPVSPLKIPHIITRITAARRQLVSLSQSPPALSSLLQKPVLGSL